VHQGRILMRGHARPPTLWAGLMGWQRPRPGR